MGAKLFTGNGATLIGNKLGCAAGAYSLVVRMLLLPLLVYCVKCANLQTLPHQLSEPPDVAV